MDYIVNTPYDVMTADEKAEGWHFCPEWDFMLISGASPEAECCTCEVPK